MKRTIRIASFALLAFVHSTLAASASITSVDVLDSAFVPVKHLSDQSQLQQFETHWAQKVETKLQSAKWEYKLDIRTSSSSVRWLYTSSGLVRKLDKQATPIYQLRDISRFNNLIGVSGP